MIKCGILVSTGVNFINILRAAFVRADPKSAKKTVQSISFFVILLSAHVKAVHKNIGEINPRS